MHPVASTGISPLDQALGGLPSGSLTQLYGPSGAGKTTAAAVVARARAPAAMVLPEAPHRGRLAELLGDGARRVVVARPSSLAEQTGAVVRAARLLEAGRVNVVVLDSLTFLYRFEALAGLEALRELYAQLGALHKAVRASGGLALFTNQVSGGPGERRPVGGAAIEHASDVVLSIEPLEGTWRRLRVEKHPVRAAGEAFDVRIGPRGFE